MVKKNKEVIGSKDLRTKKLTETWRTLTNLHLNHTHTHVCTPLSLIGISLIQTLILLCF